jgi:hypothetical protein
MDVLGIFAWLYVHLAYKITLNSAKRELADPCCHTEGDLALQQGDSQLLEAPDIASVTGTRLQTPRRDLALQQGNQSTW